MQSTDFKLFNSASHFTQILVLSKNHQKIFILLEAFITYMIQTGCNFWMLLLIGFPRPPLVLRKVTEFLANHLQWFCIILELSRLLLQFVHKRSPRLCHWTSWKYFQQNFSRFFLVIFTIIIYLLKWAYFYKKRRFL